MPHRGVRHRSAALDRASGQMFFRFRDCKRWRESFDFLKQLRRRCPAGNVVADSFSPDNEHRVTSAVRAHNVGLVFTPPTPLNLAAFVPDAAERCRR
jgi:hypothetical protein